MHFLFDRHHSHVFDAVEDAHFGPRDAAALVRVQRVKQVPRFGSRQFQQVRCRHDLGIETRMEKQGKEIFL